jgi:REP element-mobilizing transposase RayT
MDSEKYKRKYRISSARLPGWDYGANGAYFITVCVKDRMRCFGEIEKADIFDPAYLNMTEIGEVAFDNWEKIPGFHPYVDLDEFSVMPDHMHGILFINKPDKQNWEKNKFGPQRKNLASIMRGYKSSVTKYANLNAIEFSWQDRYYDRVIRDEHEYLRIKKYIQDNPDQWYANGSDFDNLFKP